METLKWSFFSLMSLNNHDHKRYSRLLYCYSCLCARYSTKKVSFIGHFKKIIKIMFREVLCTLCQLYSASTDCSTKETNDRFSRRAI